MYGTITIVPYIFLILRYDKSQSLLVKFQDVLTKHLYYKEYLKNPYFKGLKPSVNCQRWALVYRKISFSVFP